MGENKKEDSLGQHWKGSFEEYLEWLSDDPEKQLRSARQYLYDAILSFGVGDVEIEETGEVLKEYYLFTEEFDHRKEHEVHGMDRRIEILMKHLESRAQRMQDLPRMIVLNGPPGSSKSSTIERLRVALEEYSHSDEGAMFTTTVLLPRKEPRKKGSIGFLKEEGCEDECGCSASYSSLDREEILAQITCPQHDSPLLWYPREMRKSKLEEIVGEPIDETNIPEEILYGDLCPVCSQIQDYLMAEYDDDIEEVMKHIRVDRFRFKGDETGIATVSPGTSQNFTALSTAMDPNYELFAQRFPGIKLLELDGAYLRANRGIIHLEDFVKATGGNVSFLLRAISNGQLTTKDLRTGKEITVTVDEVILSTDNVEEIEVMRERGSKGFDSRIFVVNWPYVLDPSAEVKIYEQDFAERGSSDPDDERAHIAPHVKELTALFSVMTRLDEPQTREYARLQNYSDEMMKLINSLSPLDKAKLYDGKLPERFSKEQGKTLTQDLWRILRNEHPDEGMNGVGVRDMQEVVNLLSPSEECGCILPTDLFTVINDFLETDSFHYMNTALATVYHNPVASLELIKKEYRRIVSDEVVEAMTSISPKKICSWIDTYVSLVIDSKEQKFLGGSNSGKNVDEEQLDEFEELLGLSYQYEKEEWRDEVRTRVAQYHEQLHDWEGYRRVFHEIYNAIESDRFGDVREEFFSPEGSVRESALEAIAKFDPEHPESTPDPYREPLERTFTNLENFGYCTDCARKTLIYTLDNELV